jgi:hypothetical protein
MPTECKAPAGNATFLQAVSRHAEPAVNRMLTAAQAFAAAGSTCQMSLQYSRIARSDEK